MSGWKQIKCPCCGADAQVEQIDTMSYLGVVWAEGRYIDGTIHCDRCGRCQAVATAVTFDQVEKAMAELCLLCLNSPCVCRKEAGSPQAVVPQAAAVGPDKRLCKAGRCMGVMEFRPTTPEQQALNINAYWRCLACGVCEPAAGSSNANVPQPAGTPGTQTIRLMTAQEQAAERDRLTDRGRVSSISLAKMIAGDNMAMLRDPIINGWLEEVRLVAPVLDVLAKMVRDLWVSRDAALADLMRVMEAQPNAVYYYDPKPAKAVEAAAAAVKDAHERYAPAVPRPASGHDLKTFLQCRCGFYMLRYSGEPDRCDNPKCAYSVREPHLPEKLTITKFASFAYEPFNPASKAVAESRALIEEYMDKQIEALIQSLAVPKHLLESATHAPTDDTPAKVLMILDEAEGVDPAQWEAWRHFKASDPNLAPPAHECDYQMLLTSKACIHCGKPEGQE